jgi:hypothetical protein
MVYTLRFFLSKCSLFHNSNVFGSCIIHILRTGCAKIKKNNSDAKRLNIGEYVRLSPYRHSHNRLFDKESSVSSWYLLNRYNIFPVSVEPEIHYYA